MIRPVSASGGVLRASLPVLLCLLGIIVLYVALPPLDYRPGSLFYPAGSRVQANVPGIDYELTTADLEVDWSAGGPDFDPRGKCPEDFSKQGFKLLIKDQGKGGTFYFLYHQGKKLLYRIDKEVFRGKVRVGLHWVTSTRFNARYRIADPAYKGGKAVDVPTAKGGTTGKTFHYGQAVSKRRTQYRRELFRETHIRPGQCPEWWDIFNFKP